MWEARQNGASFERFQTRTTAKPPDWAEGKWRTTRQPSPTFSLSLYYVPAFSLPFCFLVEDQHCLGQGLLSQDHWTFCGFQNVARSEKIRKKPRLSAAFDIDSPLGRKLPQVRHFRDDSWRCGQLDDATFSLPWRRLKWLWEAVERIERWTSPLCRPSQRQDEASLHCSSHLEF